MGRHRNYALGGLPTPEATDAMLQKTFHLSSAQVLALHTGPVQILSAPGANRCYYLFGAISRLNFATTAYAFAGSGLFVLIGDVANNDGFLFLDQPTVIYTANFIEGRGPTVEQAADDRALLENMPVSLYADVSNPTLGDSTFDITLFYSIATFS